MRIGFDFRMGGTLGAGIGRYSLELLRRILARDRQNHYTIFYHEVNCHPNEIEELRRHHNATVLATRIRHYSLTEQICFLQVLKRHRFDLVHFPNFNVPVRYRQPFIATIHDVIHHRISGHKKSRLHKFWAYKYIIQQTAKNAAKIITVSEAAKQDIVELLRVPKEKVTVIYESGVLEAQDENFVRTVKQKYLLHRPYFLFVGTLERKKNVAALTRAFNFFLEKHRLDMDLVVVGKIDAHYPEAKQEALEIKNKDRLVFTGYVDDKTLAALYQSAYAFTSCSLHEGFGLPGVEAMHFGLPLLVTNMPVFNEIYDNAAIYFDPADLRDVAEKMFLVASDRLFYEQLRQKSLNRGTNFSWEQAAEETLRLYAAFVNQPNIVKDI